MTTYELVRDAIENRKQIACIYDGKYREVCPHVLGDKNGVAHAFCYQFGGASSKPLEPLGSPNNWRCMEIGKMQSVESRDGDWFTSREGIGRQDCVYQIVAIDR